MPNATRDGPAGHRYSRPHSPYAHGQGHGHGNQHCPTHCRYCGPDAGAWDVGEFAVGLLVAVFAVVRWLARRPIAVLLVAVAAALAWTLIGSGLGPG
jgi:hypothetical protein